MKLHRLFIFISFFFFCHTSVAEPWIANRVAQNCAACHTPGRVNRKAAERRCTLSCQSCHVNPSGQGIRTAYGKWFQKRWLYSFYHEKFGFNGLKPQPLTKRKKRRRKNKTVKVRFNSERTKQGFIFPDEKNYDRSAGRWKRIETDLKKWLRRIPKADPYHQENRPGLTAGIEYRHQAHLPLEGGGFNLFPMTVDVGARLRPIASHLQLVAEARFLNGPSNTAFDAPFTSEARAKSAYVLVNDLPFNSYVMHGLYTPLFGLMETDHRSLSSTLKGFNQRSVFRASGIGSAPNVPNINLHLIHPISVTNYTSANASGFAGNIGLRAVKLGASLGASYWRTNASGTVREMFSFTGGVHLSPLTVNAELARVSLTSLSTNAGFFASVQTKTQVWRQSYALLNFVFANTTPNLSAGSSWEALFGYRIFLLAGMDLQLDFVMRNVTVTAVSTSTKAMRAQLHLFL